MTSSDSHSSGGAPTAAEQAAAVWVVRCNAGLTPAQQAEFDQWLEEDPAHASLFEELDGTWVLFDQIKPAAQESARDALRFAATHGGERGEDTTRPGHAPRYAKWLVTTLAAAAAVTLAYTLWWQPAYFRHVARTDIGGRHTVVAPDGSTIGLNTDSVVSVVFQPNERRVRLERGEALFTVAKDRNRPFIVEVNGIAVRAVGTAFNIRVRAAAVEVLVKEGRVQVDDVVNGSSLLPVMRQALPQETVRREDEQRVLHAGQRAVLAIAGSSLAPTGPAVAKLDALPLAEIERELAWQGGRLEFVSAPLTEIVAAFNRYNRQKLVIADERLGQEKFGGVFQATDPARFVRMLAESFPVSVETRPGTTVLRMAP